MRKLVFCFIIMLLTCGISIAQNVIDPELQTIIDQKGNEKISVNIIFKSQPNRDYLRERSSNFINKETKRQAVIQELKNFSEESQQDVL